MPTVFKDSQRQDEESSADLSGEESAPSLDSKPDLILEHGKTRLTLDLDGWEWFWLFLAIVFCSSLWIWLT